MNMKTLKKLRLVLVFSSAWLLLSYADGRAQTKEVNPPPATTTSGSRQSSSAEELRKFKSNGGTDKMQESLLQTRTALETGIASNSLSEKEIADLKAKIAAIEGRISTQGSVPAVTPPGVRGITRSQFVQMNMDQQRNVLTDHTRIQITDLVNATSADLNQRLPNVFYVPAEDFRNYDISRKIQILNNPDTYKVVSAKSAIPKIQISRTEFNSLPATKQESIRNSGEFVITD